MTSIGGFFRTVGTPSEEFGVFATFRANKQPMKTRTLLVTASLFGALTLAANAAVINLSTAVAAQSSTLSTFGPGNALDNIVNFTHTQGTDPNPTWQLLLGAPEAFADITVFNRQASDGATACCPSRLRDITIQVVSFTGNVFSDFTGGTVIFSSPLLNAENVLGGGTNTAGPVSLSASPGGAVGNLIRIIRTPDPDLSGSGGFGNTDEAAVLSIDLVTAESIPEPGTSLLGLFGLAMFAMRRRR